MFAICNLAIIPLRAEPSDRSEIVSQVLFGEHFEIIETQKQWAKIRLQFDDYEGWVDSKQYQIISEKNFSDLSKDGVILNADLVEYVTNSKNMFIPVPLGASLSFLNHAEINIEGFEFEGMKISGIKDKSNLISTAYQYLNAP
ncbi:MAG: SH3 domain-containing protein, partial [Flavobacterium macrobrachii]